MKKNKGFTLVELLAVIVILALIMIIAIPTVLTILNNARKQSFYLYAQSVYQKAMDKYVSESNSNIKSKLDCSVYKINSEDLDISNTGDYEGWVKVLRVPAASGRWAYSKKVSAGSKLYNVRYCMIQGKNECNPTPTTGEMEDPTYYSSYVETNDGNEAVINEVRENENYTLCVTYQYPDSNGHMVQAEKSCSVTDKHAIQDDSYEYNVILSMRNRDRAVDYVLMKSENENKTFKDQFYEYMDNYKTQNEGDARMPITELSCSGTEDKVYKDGQKATTVVTTTNPNERESTKATYTVTANDVTVVTTTADPGRGNVYATTTTEAGRGNVYATTTTTVQGNVYATTTNNVGQGNVYATTTTTVQGNVYATTTNDPGRGNVYATTTTTVQGQQQYTTGAVEEKSTSKIVETTFAGVDESILLQSLSVEGYDIGFLPVQQTYHITVPYNTESLSISALPRDGNAKVEMNGDKQINIGDNTIAIHVYRDGENAQEIFYYIYVHRLGGAGNTGKVEYHRTNKEYDPASGLPDPTLAASNSKLANIGISGFKLNDPFDPNVYDYDIELPADVHQLAMYVVPQDINATVSTNGNSDLKDGSVITIEVVSQNGYYVDKYTVTVHEKKETAKSTVVIRTIAVGLLAVLIILLIAIRMKKKNVGTIKNDDDNQNNQGGYVQPTEMNNSNNNQGNV